MTLWQLVIETNDIMATKSTGNAEHNPPRRETFQHPGEHQGRHQAVRLLNQRATHRFHRQDQGRGVQTLHGPRENRAHQRLLVCSFENKNNY